MDDIFLFDGEIALNYIFGNPQGGQLGEFAFLLDEVEEITVFAVLGDDIDIIFGHEDVNGLEDVGVFEAFESVNFVVEEVLFDLILYFGEFDDFDGDVFFLRIGLELIDAPVHMGAEAFADEIARVVYEIFYFFG